MLKFVGMALLALCAQSVLADEISLSDMANRARSNSFPVCQSAGLTCRSVRKVGLNNDEIPNIASGPKVQITFVDGKHFYLKTPVESSPQVPRYKEIYMMAQVALLSDKLVLCLDPNQNGWDLREMKLELCRTN